MTDAFKPDQVPGASGADRRRPGGGVGGTAGATATPAPRRSVHGGVDTALGGLY